MKYNQKIINKTMEYVKSRLEGEATGHDWWHVFRVWKMTQSLTRGEKVNLFVVELAALLHDIADWKMHGGDDTLGPQVAKEWLESIKVDVNTICHVCAIIQDVSFKGVGVKSKMNSLEGMIVQDADRLDAIGAIGIARTFAYGGNRGREIYNPYIKPRFHHSFDEYKKSDGPTINHFYEKLLLLKDLINTSKAKKIALKRHKYMEKFLSRFYKEWEGEE